MKQRGQETPQSLLLFVRYPESRQGGSQAPELLSIIHLWGRGREYGVDKWNNGQRSKTGIPAGDFPVKTRYCTNSQNAPRNTPPMGFPDWVKTTLSRSIIGRNTPRASYRGYLQWRFLLKQFNLELLLSSVSVSLEKLGVGWRQKQQHRRYSLVHIKTQHTLRALSISISDIYIYFWHPYEYVLHRSRPRTPSITAILFTLGGGRHDDRRPSYDAYSNI